MSDIARSQFRVRDRDLEAMDAAQAGVAVDRVTLTVARRVAPQAGLAATE